MKLAGNYVLDSFAVLAYLENETSADEVRRVLEYGSSHAGCLFLSLVNYGECLYIIERERGLEAAHESIAAIDRWPVTVVPPDRDLTFAAAHIKARHSVSFADAFTVALAQSREATVLTGDPEFKSVAHLIAIHWLRR